MKNYDLIPTASKSKQKLQYCVHGPNLLLEDLNEQIPEYKRKWVCSAIRTNECKPFLNFDLKRFKETHFQKRKNFQNRLIQTVKLAKGQRRWCVDCSLLVLPNELDEHQDHFIKENLSIRQLRMPTKLISANVDKKEEAQYFFSDESLKVILKTIIRCKFTHVLCIGCPSIHEQLNVHSKRYSIQSFLLDIDARYLQFYSSKQFLCFNMANNFLFEKDKYERNLNEFLSSSSKLLVIADPPFGIMIPALADTLVRLKKKINYFKKDDSEFELKMMLFHLYFYEKRIADALPDLRMMDYKISYANHKKLKADANSAARLFTDIDGKQLVLKGLDGYKFCADCQRWTHEIASHCFDCKNCMSKNGKESAHCSLCDRCFQLDWEHCFTCEMCTRKGECKCGGNLNNKLSEYECGYSDGESNHGEATGDRDENKGEQDEAVSDRQPRQPFNANGFDRRRHGSGGFKERRFSNQRNHSRSFGGKFGDRKFSRDRNSSGDRSFGRDRSFNRDSSFGRERKFGAERKFGGERRFGGERSFRKEKEITKDDFNSMFFSKGKSSSGQRSPGRSGSKFGGANRSKRPFSSPHNGRAEFKKRRFGN